MVRCLFLLHFCIGFFACQKKIINGSLNIDNSVFNIKDSTSFTYFEFDRKKNKCNHWESYVPDSLHPELQKLRIVKVNFVIVHDSSGMHNYKEGVAQTYFSNMITNANERLLKNFKMNLPLGNNTPNLNPQLHWKITSSRGFEKENGFYFVKENKVDAFYINHGRGQNNYKKAVIDRNLFGADSILNIFIISHPPDSLNSKTFKKKTAGIALGSAVKLGGLFHKKQEDWMHSTLLNHEIGHIFSLSHAWIGDGCDDTPENPNCYSVTDTPPCDSVASNNLMDYNNEQMAISPCQIARMHMTIAKENSAQRKFVVKDWCKLDSSRSIVIQNNIAWEGARDINQNIIIKDGACLKLCCRVAMAEGSSITVEPGGKLILQEVKLHNDCGHTWQGVIIKHSEKKKASIEIIGKSEILNTQYIISSFSR